MLSLVIWFHYDLQGYWEQKNFERVIRREAERQALAEKYKAEQAKISAKEIADGKITTESDAFHDGYRS